MPSSAAALAELFSKARLDLNIPSSPSSPSTSRSVVFFDEVLNVEAVLTLPSDPLLPVASSSTQGPLFSQPLPLPALPSRSHLGHESIPPHLNALLACLHVNLVTDYVPHQPTSASQLSKSTNPYEPLSTVQLHFQQLQLLPSHNPHADPSQPQHAAVRAFSNAWAGNQPPKSHRTLKDTADPSASLPLATSSHRAHLTHDAQHWRVHWHCRVPINYIATPFQPLLSVTTALTLRLDHALLDQFLPASASHAFVRSGFSHSLLAPLHEGPVYPDESPLQSQARATASSVLGLDGPNGLGSFLAHLPKDVVGGNHTVVTPRSGAAALHAIQQRRNDALATDAIASRSLSKPDSNGDLAALSSRLDSSSHLAQTAASQATNKALPSDTEHAAAGLQIYKCSTRQVLPLKTGLNVRMRTLVTRHDPFTHSSPSLTHQPAAELESTRIVLSVESENPLESESTFAVNNIQIEIDDGNADRQETNRIVAKPLRPIPSVLPIDLTKGSQHNLLFFVSVESDHASHSNEDVAQIRGVSARNVTITVSGRPKPVQGEKEELADFDSQWNCALDLAPVLADADKKSFIASDARTARLDRSTTGGPVAGNAQYSASSLRAAQSGYIDSAPPMARQGQIEDARTPRPGELGMGFPPPLRTSSARHFSTAASIIDHQPEPAFPAAEEDGFLKKAKARAANRHSNVPPNEGTALTVRPWMSSSAATREAASGAGGLVVLSTLRRVGNAKAAAEGEVRLESTLGQDGVSRPSVSTGAKTLHPASVSATSGEGKGVRAQTGDTIVVDLALLHKSPTLGVVGDVHLSWTAPTSVQIFDPSTRGSRNSIDASTGLAKGRLMDADSARLRSALTTSQADAVNGLVPLQDNVLLQGVQQQGQSRKIAFGLRCLSPGYHAVPPLRMRFDTLTGAQEEVVLEDLGAVHVTPAAVL